MAESPPSARLAIPSLTWWGALYAGLLATSAISGYFALRGTPSPPQPGLSWDPSPGQFGNVGQGAVLDATFEVTNNFQGPVEITEVNTGCSCRSAIVSRKYLGPGERSSVKITWSVGAKRGEVADEVWLVYTTPGAAAPSRAPLRLEANVLPDIRFEPNRVAFRLGQPGTARVKLTPGQMPAFIARGTLTNSTALAAICLHGGQEVEIRYTPGSELDAVEGRFVAIDTDSPNEPQLRIPVVIERP